MIKMQFVDKFEPLVRTVDDVVISLGLFGSYSEAQDAAIKYSSEELPQERVKAFEIHHVFVNMAAIEPETIRNGGIF